MQRVIYCMRFHSVVEVSELEICKIIHNSPTCSGKASVQETIVDDSAYLFLVLGDGVESTI